MANSALSRIQSRGVDEPVVEEVIAPALDPLEQQMVEPVVSPPLEVVTEPVEVVKDAPASTSLASTGALQGPLQDDETKGGAMSSPGVAKPVAKKKPAAKPVPASKSVVDKDKSYIAPKPPNILQRGKVGLVVTKAADGKRLLMMITTNSYRDREKEAIATKALSRYVEKAWNRVEDKCLPDNELRLWHNGTIGKIVYADMEGPFLIEVAKELPDKLINVARPNQKPFMVRIKEVWDYLEENPDGLEWGASHGFKHYKSQLTKDGVYQTIYKFESSVLPLQWAANPYTFSGVVDMEPRDKLLQQLVGRANAKALRQGARQLKKALDVKGVQHKEVKAKPTDKAKGLLEDLEEKFAQIVADLTDDSDKQQRLQEELTEAVVSCLSPDEIEPEQVGGTEDEAKVGYHYDSADSAPIEETPPEEEEKEDDGEDNEMEHPEMPMKKELKAFDLLVESQSALLESTEQISERLKSLDGVAKLPAEFEKLSARMKALETQLKMRPRAASEADETVVEDADLLERVKKAMAQYDPFFGVHVQEE